MPLFSLFARARHELRVWSSPLSNPFLAQARRVDARGVRWLLSMLFIAGFWAAMLVGITLITTDRWGEPRDRAANAVRLWIGVVWVLSFFLARVRDGELLRQEVVKGRFEPLQLLPLSSTRRAWLWSASNSLWGLLLAATMLPAIAWGLGGGLLEGREALLLILLVLLTLWNVPTWAPVAWRIQSAKPAETAKDNLKALGGNGARAKVGDGFVLPPDLAVSARGWGGGLSLTAPIWFMAQFGLRGVLGGIALSYWNGLPLHVRAASGELWFNWPIFLVRWLGEVQPFFGFALAPIALLLPIWLAGAVVRVLRLAAVTGREPFWTAARLLLWRRLQTLQSALWFALLLGLLWPGAIEGAWLTSWWGQLAGTPAAALAAWWIVALAAGAFATTAMWRAALELPVGAITLRAQAPRAAKLALRGLGVALLFWAGGCLLGWRWPFSALWLQIVPASLAMAAVWIVAQSAMWAGHRAPRFGTGFLIWHALWFYVGPIGGVLLLVLAQFPVSLIKVFYPLSPWTLWLMLRDPNVAGNSIFWIAVGAHTTLALLTGTVAWWLGRDALAAPALPNAPDTEAVLDELAPTAAPANAPAIPPTLGTISLSRKPLAAPDALTTRILNALRRFDNPLLILEMRRGLSADVGAFMRWMLFIQALILVVPLAILPLVNVLTGVWASEAFVFFVALMLFVQCVAALLGNSGSSYVYDRDRLDGTLELLFLTPRTQAEIAWGKVGPFLMRSALLWLVFAPLYLIGLALLPTAGQPLITTAYAVAPLWIAALTLRSVFFSHWVALKKRKVGAATGGAGFALLELSFIIGELATMGAAFYLGVPFVVGVAILLTAIFALESWWLWERGLRELGRQRAQGVPLVK